MTAGLFETASETYGCPVAEALSCHGGDINEAWRLRFEDGTEAFLKSRPGASVEEFELEGAGLRWLSAADALPVPGVLGVVGGEQPGLLLEWIEPGGRLNAEGEAVFGVGLARIHRLEADAFGRLPDDAPDTDLRVGPVSLGNDIEPDTGQGFAHAYGRRLEGLAAQALDRGHIESEGAALISTLSGRIEELAGPAEPAARTHGDLWSGNVLVASDGSPW